MQKTYTHITLTQYTGVLCTHTQMSTQTHTHRRFFYTHTCTHTNWHSLSFITFSVSVAAHFITTACFVTKVTQTPRWQNVSNFMHCLHVLSLWHAVSPQHHYSDKTCRKVHLLQFCHPFTSNSIICLSFPSMCWCVHARVGEHLSVAARAHAHVCVVV